MSYRSSSVRRRGNAGFAVVLVLAGLLLAGVMMFLFLTPGATVHPIASSSAVTTAAPAPAAGPSPAADLTAPAAAAVEESSNERTAVADAVAPVQTTVAQAATAGGRLLGSLVDDSGVPVVDAEISVSAGGFGFGMPPRAARTDGSGAFEVEGVGGRVWSLTATAPGFAPLLRGNVAVPEGGDLDLGVLTIARGAILTGRVIDESGAGVAGVDLHRRLADWFDLGARLDREPLAVTDAGGAFRIDQIEAGPWAVVANSEEHPPAVFEGVAPDPGVPVTDLEFLLPIGATIRGTVEGAPRDRIDKLVVHARSVEDESVQHTRSVDLDADGGFVVRGLVPDARYRLQAREEEDLEGDTEGRIFFGWGESRSQPVFARAGEDGVRLLFEVAATITFRVVDGATGEPIEQFEAWADGEFRRDEATLPDGTPSGDAGFPGGLAAVERGSADFGSGDGETELVIEAVGFETQRRPLGRVTPGTTIDLGDVVLSAADVVAVRVIDRETGEPVAGASVDVTPWSPAVESGAVQSFSFRVSAGSGDASVEVGGGRRSATTDEEGIARFNQLGDGKVVVAVQADGYARYEREGLELEAGEPPVELALDEGGAVRVTVVDEAGQPVPGARVEHRAPQGAAAQEFRFVGLGNTSEVANAEGRVDFDHLMPGEHRFRVDTSRSGGMGLGRLVVFGVEGGGEDENWTTVQVKGGEVASVTVVAPTLTTVEGRILEAGQPLVGAEVSLAEANAQSGFVMPGMGGPSARTDADGRYDLDGLEPGDYVLTVSHPTRAMDHELEVELVDPLERFDVDLPVTIVAGRITDPDGEPVAGVEVSASIVQEASSGGATRGVVGTFVMAGGGGEVISFGGDAADTATRTDAEGYFELRGVAGDRLIQVEADPDMGQAAESEPLEVPTGQRRDGVDLVVAPAGAIDVELVDGDGRPKGMALVTATWAEGGDDAPEPLREFINDSGQASLSGLRPGRWEVSAREMGPQGSAPSTSQTVDVAAGERLPLTLTID